MISSNNGSKTEVLHWLFPPDPVAWHPLDPYTPEYRALLPCSTPSSEDYRKVQDICAHIRHNNRLCTIVALTVSDTSLIGQKLSSEMIPHILVWDRLYLFGELAPTDKEGLESLLKGTGAVIKRFNQGKVGNMGMTVGPFSAGPLGMAPTKESEERSGRMLACVSSNLEKSRFMTAEDICLVSEWDMFLCFCDSRGRCHFPKNVFDSYRNGLANRRISYRRGTR